MAGKYKNVILSAGFSFFVIFTSVRRIYDTDTLSDYSGIAKVRVLGSGFKDRKLKKSFYKNSKHESVKLNKIFIKSTD